MIATALSSVAIAVYLVWPVVLHKAAQAIVASQEIGTSKTAPDFTLPDAKGERLRLADYKGKVVLLNFWATWCGPCKVEIPWFIDFEQTYKDRNFTVVGISMDDDGWTSVKPYVQKRKINYPVFIGSEEVSTKYGGVDSLPTTFVIDQAGRIASIH